MDVRGESSAQGKQLALESEAVGTCKRPPGQSCSKQRGREQRPGEHGPDIPPTAGTWANKVVVLLRREFPLPAHISKVLKVASLSTFFANLGGETREVSNLTHVDGDPKFQSTPILA